MEELVSLKEVKIGDEGRLKAANWKYFQHFRVISVTHQYIVFNKSFCGDFSDTREFCISINRENDYRFTVYRKEMEKPKYKVLGDSYVLTEDYHYQTNLKVNKTIEHKYFTVYTSGRVVIREGYKWDGATGIPDNKFNIRASLVHDVLCQAMKLNLLSMSYRSKSDKVFTNIAKEDGMPKVIADLHFWGLRIYGVLRYGH